MDTTELFKKTKLIGEQVLNGLLMGFAIALPGIMVYSSLSGFIDDNFYSSPKRFIIFGLLLVTALFIMLTKDVNKKNKRLIFFAIIIFTILYNIIDLFIPIVFRV